MPSEEVMYLTILSNSAFKYSTKIKPGTELACLDQKGNNFFFHKTFAWTQKCTDLFSPTNVSNSGCPFTGTCCISGHIIII